MEQSHPQGLAHAPDTDMTPERRWQMFTTRSQLESSTNVSFKEQAKLESIPKETLQHILQKINEGTHLRVIHRYLQEFYSVDIDRKELARYWRRTLPAYTQAEAQQRELRTAERALRQINQKDEIS